MSCAVSKRVGIIASGPSATAQDAAKLRAVCDEVIAINDSYRLCLESDHLYGTDMRWWKYALEDVRRHFHGNLWTQRVGWTEEPEALGIACLESSNGDGLCTEEGKVFTGQNSGYAAINLAYHFGAKTVILLGFDLMMTGNKRHWHTDRPANLNAQSPYHSFIKNFQTIHPEEYGMEIWNVSRRTALTHFPWFDLDDLYARLDHRHGLQPALTA